MSGRHLSSGGTVGTGDLEVMANNAIKCYGILWIDRNFLSTQITITAYVYCSDETDDKYVAKDRIIFCSQYKYRRRELEVEF